MSSVEKKERNWLCDIILPKILKSGKLVKNYNPEKENTFKIHDVNVEFIGPEEAFMLTICYRATVNFEYENNLFTEFIVVKKTPILTKDIYDTVGFKMLFENEIHAYTNLIPAMEKFSGEVFEGPKLFYSESHDDFATIVLEDFGVSGWRVAKKRYDLSLDHALQAVKYLGKFHGTCLAWQHCNPLEVKELRKQFQESRFQDAKQDGQWSIIVKTTLKRSIQAAKKYEPEITEEFMKTFEKVLDDYFKLGKYCIEPKEPLSTLCHGDYLRNNIAFKYADEKYEKPIDVLMFDLQTIRYCSPMLDFATFLHLSIMAHVRQPHFEEIFNTYVTSISNQFTKLAKTDIPDFLSKDNLFKEYLRLAPYGIATCATFLGVLIEGHRPDLSVELSDEELIAMQMEFGGETYDTEMSIQFKDFFDMCNKFNINIAQVYESLL